jgi:small subunit ribosomal protein S3Ae
MLTSRLSFTCAFDLGLAVKHPAPIPTRVRSLYDPASCGARSFVCCPPGKNKRLTKSKKGGKKKAQNPLDKKEWYTIKAPSMFAERNAGKTLITRTQGTKIASEGLKGRVFEISLADLNKDEDQTFRKIKLCCEDVQGYNCVTNFHGMDLTRDKLCSLIKKWVTMIEANVDVKTTDGALSRCW